MSASWNKSVLNLPFLPPELWLRIFDDSTWVPGVLEPDIYDTSDEPQRLLTRKQQRLLKDSLVTKRYLVRVCKRWCTLATPKLYEAVVIGRGRTLPSLCSALVNSKRKADLLSGDHHHLGWYTKRLDIAMRDQGHHSAAELESLAEVIQCFPNLTIAMFSVRAPRYFEHALPTPIMQALAATCGISLRVIDFSESVLHPFRHDWRALLTAAPRLRVLRGPYATPTSPDHIRPLPDLPVLSELTALTLASPNCKEYLTQETRFPSLREVELHYFIPPVWDTQAGPLCLFGPNLTIIHLNFNIGGSYLQKEMDVLSRHCPNLMRLVLSLKVWEQFADHLSLPSVSYFGLRCWQYQAPSHVYRWLFTSLSTISGPTLKTVRLCDHHNVNDLRIRHATVLAYGLEQISHCSFQLEDHEGWPFLRYALHFPFHESVAEADYLEPFAYAYHKPCKGNSRVLIYQYKQHGEGY